MSIVPIYRSALNRPARLSGLNLTQVRTSFYNKYKHGPTRASNPRPDYIKWLKDFFGPEGREYVVKQVKRIAKKPFQDPLMKAYEPNTLYKFERFDSEERLKLWKPVADSDAKNGFSISTIVRSPNGHGLFKGILDNRLPDDGITQKSGFVGVIGPRAQSDVFLENNPTWDWEEFNTVEIKFRGDGRKYFFVVNVGRYDEDILGYDIYAIPLHTRGGPYWQVAKIPISKLIFAAKGCIQDQQYRFPSIKVKFVAFTLSDTYDGPFSLEIDYIGLRWDYKPFVEYCAYERYSYPHIMLKQINPGCDPPDTE